MRSQLSLGVRWHGLGGRPILRKVAVLICALSVACVSQEEPVAGDNLNAQQKCLAFDTTVLGGADSAISGWYWQELRAMKEPRIASFADSSETEVVRFLWLRSFKPTITVRAIRRGSRYALIRAQLSNPEGLCPGTIDRRDSVRLSSRTWKTLIRALENPEFVPAPLPTNTVGADGAQWVVESVRQGHYQLVDVWAPKEQGRGSNVRALGLEMVRSAGLMPWPWEIY